MKSSLHRLVPGAALVLIGFGGAAQAQVHPYVHTDLSGAHERPPINSNGSGTMVGVYNESSNAIYWYVEYELDTSSTTMTDSHFHGPANTNQSAGVRLGLGPGSIPSFPLGREGVFRGSAMVNPAHRNEVLGELWYINLHSNQFGPGELRGQLIPGPFTHYFDSDPITGDQETPPVTTDATGTIDAAYDANTRTLTWGLKWQNLSTTVVGMHFHVGAPGEPGPITVDFGNVGSFPTQTTGAFAGFAVLTQEQEDALLAGNFFVNIHTTQHGPGEIRGQLNPIPVVAPVPPLLGDINDDGIVNVEDVTELANLVAAGTPPDVEIGDINGDGEVNELDVQALAEMIVD